MDARGEHGVRALDALWRAEAAQRCRVALAETVLLGADGTPQRWLFTSKSGEIVKKRSASLAVLRTKAGQATAGPARCLAYARDGSTLLLDLSAVEEPAELKGPVALQLMVPSERAGSLYRARYKSGGRRGRVAVSTCSVSWEATEAMLGAKVRREGEGVACRATAINEALGAATQAIVDYVELMTKSRISELECEYCLDGDGNPWLLWVSRCAQEGALPHSPTQTGGTTKVPAARRRRQRGRRNGADTGRLSPRPTSPAEALVVGIQVSHATSRIEQPAAARLDPDSPGARSAAQKRDRFSVHNPVVLEDEPIGLGPLGLSPVQSPSPTDNGSCGLLDDPGLGLNERESSEAEQLPVYYPNPFNCHGDFCDFRVKDPDGLARDGQASGVAIARELLSADEMRTIGKRRGNDGDTLVSAFAFGWPKGMLREGNAGRGQFTLPMKSVAAARKEKRGYLKRLGQEPEPAAPPKRYMRGKNRGVGPDAADKMTAEHGGMSLGLYYKQVRVCATCYRVYKTLDVARDMLQEESHKEHQSSRRRQSAESEAARESLIARLSTKRGRPRSREARGAASAGVQTPSPVRSARRYMEDVPSILPSASTPSLPAVDQREVELKKVEAATSAVATAIVKASDGATTTRAETQELKEKHKMMKSFEDLDGYLRGTRKKKYTMASEREDARAEDERAGKRSAGGSAAPAADEAAPGGRGHVVVVDEDPDVRDCVSRVLAEHDFAVTEFEDSPAALELCKDQPFDLMLLSTELATFSGVETVKIIRKREAQAAENSATGTAKRLPVVALSYNTSPEDLRMYREVGMSGCISKPVDEDALLKTVEAAVPKSKRVKARRRRAQAAKPVPAFRPGSTGLVTSSEVAKLSLPMPSANARPACDLEPISTGTCHLDADTSFPYLVMGDKAQGTPLFNFVVVQDFFDTYESMQIFFRPIVTKYPGMQVLVFNLPGQAFTEWRRDVVLNNEFYAHCVDALLRHVDYNGTKEFDTRGPYATPFYLLGFGNGANIGALYALREKPRMMRALLLLNGFSHVDPHLAGILHDCMNVFSCSTPARPDLPVYFYTRFLFSPAYLSKVSTPLALNLYTAVHNPITLQGRMQICKGALAHKDLREMLRETHLPMILVQSSLGGLVKPLHVEPFVQVCGGESRSVRQCLKERRRPCVIWLRAGHELFQEGRRPLSDLIEQLATGYHEKHDVAFLPTNEEMQEAAKKKQGASGGSGNKAPMYQHFEDRFIDNVLGTLQQVRDEGGAAPNPFVDGFVSPSGDGLPAAPGEEHGQAEEHPQQGGLGVPSELDESNDPEQNPRAEKERWTRFQEETGRETKAASAAATGGKSKAASKFGKLKVGPKAEDGGIPKITLDPSMQAFDWAQKRRRNPEAEEVEEFHPFGGPGSGATQSALRPVDVPEVREYMQWRVARNRKRLGKLVQAASVIQRGWRAFLARTLVQKLRQKKAALFIQSRWRAKLARDELKQRRAEEWAALLVQRCWRGKAGRDQFLERREQVRAARHMQRIFRGRHGKKRVDRMKARRHRAAQRIQNMIRSHIARSMTWKLREKRNACIDIQRVFRGFKGRVRARLERDKYLFSKAQTQGIDFGRQMLLEHKLHGTRLQSEVSLLTREKVETEEKVEALLAEIAEFDKGVQALEREMHELTAVETEAKGVLDEEARIELREQKMRLDREFGVMLGKISDRKERLKALEVKLQTIDRTRQGKEEELRDLERKLVVLLEEQQLELEQIKKRQEARGELMLPEKAATLIQRGGAGGGVGGGPGYQGPTPQQQQQANNMMQSTESLMKFGFMSMSLTYFSSLNMIRAMRKVGALNTVLNGPAGTPAGQADIKAILAGGPSGAGALATAGTPVADSLSFQPQHKRGEMPDDSGPVAVSAWTVNDVGDWLETLKLAQYRNCFADAAIDGAFLYDLNDDDLRNTLGIEHNLHRKKILNSITRLRRLDEAREAQSLSNSSLSQSSVMSIAAGRGGAVPLVTDGAPGAALNLLGGGGGGGGGGGAVAGGSGALGVGMSVDSGGLAAGGSGGDGEGGEGSLGVHPDKLTTMVRHGKLKDLREAMKNLPDRAFDESDVATPFIEGFGTQYRDELNRLQWHINKSDDHGNSLLTVASQNGRLKCAQLLAAKGANPNHQNNQGQTPLHYAMAYNFYDLGAWLADAEQGAGASDAVTNMYDLTPYDGLTPE